MNNENTFWVEVIECVVRKVSYGIGLGCFKGRRDHCLNVDHNVMEAWKNSPTTHINDFQDRKIDDIDGLHDYFHWQYNIKETQHDDKQLLFPLASLQVKGFHTTFSTFNPSLKNTRYGVVPSSR